MASGYLLSPEAQQDIADIRAFYVKEAGTRVALYVLREITRALRLLAANPGIGHSRDDLTDEPVKFWPVFSYLIVYDPAMTPLGVARVVHGSQDITALFQDNPPRM